jgi:hypothetical protein
MGISCERYDETLKRLSIEALMITLMVVLEKLKNGTRIGRIWRISADFLLLSALIRSIRPIRVLSSQSSVVGRPSSLSTPPRYAPP